MARAARQRQEPCVIACDHANALGFGQLREIARTLIFTGFVSLLMVGLIEDWARQLHVFTPAPEGAAASPEEAELYAPAINGSSPPSAPP